MGRMLGLTMQEIAECNAQSDLLDLEANGFVAVELLLFLYAILVMHVLIDEFYVPALELVTSREVLDVPRPLLGCTILAAGNCLPELSMSLVALLLSESQDIGTGEVFGSCVFDILAILGVVCIRLPQPALTAEGAKPSSAVGGTQLAWPLMVYFLGWVALATAIDISLFYTDIESTWPVSIVMVTLFVAFVVGVFVCNCLIPGFAAPEERLPQHSKQSSALVLPPHADSYGSAEPASALALPSPPPSLPPSPPGSALTPAPSTALTPAPSTALAPAPSTALALSPSDELAIPEMEGAAAGFDATAICHSVATGSAPPVPRETTPLLLPPQDTGSAASGSPLAIADVGGGVDEGEWKDAPDDAPADAPAALTDGRSAVSRAYDRCFDLLAAPARLVLRYTVPDAHKPTPLLGGYRPWVITIIICILYTLLLSYSMVAIATRAVCVLGLRKNSLGATVLCLSAGFPDLITAMILVKRPGPGMVEMAAANPFGAFLFNALVALGLPWFILGTYADVFPPAKGTWYPSFVGFLCIGAALLALCACRLRLSRELGYGLLALYAAYLFLIIQDGVTRPTRPVF